MHGTPCLDAPPSMHNAVQAATAGRTREWCGGACQPALLRSRVRCLSFSWTCLAVEERFAESPRPLSK